MSKKIRSHTLKSIACLQYVHKRNNRQILSDKYVKSSRRKWSRHIGETKRARKVQRRHRLLKLNEVASSEFAVLTRIDVLSWILLQQSSWLKRISFDCCSILGLYVEQLSSRVCDDRVEADNRHDERPLGVASNDRVKAGNQHDARPASLDALFQDARLHFKGREIAGIVAIFVSRNVNCKKGTMFAIRQFHK